MSIYLEKKLYPTHVSSFVGFKISDVGHKLYPKQVIKISDVGHKLYPTKVFNKNGVKKYEMLRKGMECCDKV